MSSPVSAPNIGSWIFEVRGQRIMLDAHLTALYGVETRGLNQAVRRNKERFPPDFMFELTREEVRRLSQFVITSGLPDMRFAPRVTALTENGVAMLSGVLKSPRAVQVNIEIMRAFTRLRGAWAIHRAVLRKLALLARKVAGHEDQLSILAEAISALRRAEEGPRKAIGFRGTQRLKCVLHLDAIQLFT